jgi:enoyl-CoA hydratase/carnithine racemase
MDEVRIRDERVVVLRSQGRSFAAIARLVGFGAAREAVEAFDRALRQRPAEERRRLRTEELTRLGRLSHHLEARPDLSAEELARKLGALQRLRVMVGAD